MKLIIDTNFLLIPANFKIDIITEINRISDFNYKLCIIDKTIDELKKIKETAKAKDKLAASIALQLINKEIFTTIKTHQDKLVDDLILAIAKKEKITVATQDKSLKKALKALKARIITMRSKKHLVLE